MLKIEFSNSSYFREAEATFLPEDWKRSGVQVKMGTFIWWRFRNIHAQKEKGTYAKLIIIERN